MTQCHMNFNRTGTGRIGPTTVYLGAVVGWGNYELFRDFTKKIIGVFLHIKIKVTLSICIFKSGDKKTLIWSVFEGFAVPV